MILCICPNPCIDCTLFLDNLNKGKLNRVNNKIINYSGKALNVAIGASKFNYPVFAAGFMFKENGYLFEQNLEKNGVKYQFTECPGLVRTNYKVVENGGELTEINESGETVSKEKQKELLRLVSDLSQKADAVIMSGSLPKGVENDFYLKLANAVSNKALKFIDAEGEKLRLALQSKPYMVKPNLYELGLLCGSGLKTEAEIIKGMYKALDMGAENVLLSMGGKGGMLADGKNVYYADAPEVDIISTVGAGDSMLAAAIVKTLEGCEKSEVLKAAVSAGTACAACEKEKWFTVEKYEEVYKLVKVEKIS